VPTLVETGYAPHLQPEAILPDLTPVGVHFATPLFQAQAKRATHPRLLDAIFLGTDHKAPELAELDKTGGVKHPRQPVD
jgi:hypothetical protein